MSPFRLPRLWGIRTLQVVPVRTSIRPDGVTDKDRTHVLISRPWVDAHLKVGLLIPFG